MVGEAEAAAAAAALPGGPGGLGAVGTIESGDPDVSVVSDDDFRSIWSHSWTS